MKISARNILKGKVVKILNGAVNTEVTIELPGCSLFQLSQQLGINLDLK
jgi:molybdopterin-binding protein